MRAAAACALLLGAGALAAGCDGGPAAGAGDDPAGAVEPAGAGRSAPFVLVPDAAAEAAVVRARPGEPAVVRLRLANAGAAPRDFALAATAPWIAVPATVRVPARSSVPVAAVARPPRDAAPGTRRARVAARAGGASAGGAAVPVRYESSVPVAVRVVGGGAR